MSSYKYWHEKCSLLRGKASEYWCIGCNSRKAQQWATVHGYSGKSVDHFVPMCTSCHITYDLNGVPRYSKVNQAIADEIRELRRDGVSVRELLSVLPIGRTAVRNILNGRTWNGR